jgi:hypothetical protein
LLDLHTPQNPPYYLDIEGSQEVIAERIRNETEMDILATLSQITPISGLCATLRIPNNDELVIHRINELDRSLDLLLNVGQSEQEYTVRYALTGRQILAL